MRLGVSMTDGGARWRRGCGARAMVAMVLELEIGSEGHGHPLFKALEPWEARQAEGDVGGADSNGGSVWLGYDTRKKNT